jgi:hypothetical protein
LPWTIVGGIAPRKLIYAHEFGWDQARDPVWKRLTKIYEFYDSSDSLDWAKGHGNVKQPSSEATHCTHIGQAHRKMIHPLFRKWFDVPTTTEDEYSQRLDEALLRCMTPDVTRSLHPKTLVELLRESSAERIKKARERLAGESRKDRREQLCRDWSSVLGSVKPHRRPKVVSAVADSKSLQGAKVERVLLEVETGILIPLVLLIPTKDSDQPVPVAMAVAQSGKRGFLTHRSRDVAALVSNGMAVCLPDLRGTGETRPGDGRGKLSADTADRKSVV